MPDFPLPKFHFSVDWGGTRIGFQEVTGLNIELDVLEYRDGSNPNYFKQKMPGMQKWSNITLKRGVFSDDNEFYEWYNTVKLSTVEKRNITISLLNENHEPSVVWKVRNCFIVSYKSGDLSAEDNGFLVESIDLAHEGIVVENKA